MNLKQIKQRKVRQKLAWLQSELEETKIIYKDCIEKFNTDFRNYLMGNDGPLEPAPKISKDPLDEIQSDVDEDTFKQMYRKVAGKHILIRVEMKINLNWQMKLIRIKILVSC